MFCAFWNTCGKDYKRSLLYCKDGLGRKKHDNSVNPESKNRE